MNGRRAKRLRREVWGPRKDWSEERGLHPRLRSYVISETFLKLVPKLVEAEEGETATLRDDHGKKYLQKMVEFEYYGPWFEGDRREYQRLKRRHGC